MLFETTTNSVKLQKSVVLTEVGKSKKKLFILTIAAKTQKLLLHVI